MTLSSEAERQIPDPTAQTSPDVDPARPERGRWSHLKSTICLALVGVGLYAYSKNQPIFASPAELMGLLGSSNSPVIAESLAPQPTLADYLNGMTVDHSRTETGAELATAIFGQTADGRVFELQPGQEVAIFDEDGTSGKVERVTIVRIQGDLYHGTLADETPVSYGYPLRVTVRLQKPQENGPILMEIPVENIIGYYPKP